MVDGPVDTVNFATCSTVSTEEPLDRDVEMVGQPWLVVCVSEVGISRSIISLYQTKREVS